MNPLRGSFELNLHRRPVEREGWIKTSEAHVAGSRGRCGVGGLLDHSEHVMEIEIKVGKRWSDNEEALAKRIARVVAADDTCCGPQESGYKWTLDWRGNDWKMSGIEDGVVKVSYRYGGGHPEMMAGLRAFLQWEVGWNE